MNKVIKIALITVLVVMAASCSKSPSSTPSTSSTTASSSQSSGRVSFTMASEDDFTVRLADGGGAVITSYNGKGGNIAIPAKIQGVQITLIERHFSGTVYLGVFGENVTGVQLPVGLTVIGDSAFEKSGISTVIIPNTVREIRASAFRDCKNLESISIPDSVTIGDGILQGSGIKSFTFPARLIAMKRIPRLMFSGSSLEKIVIPEGIVTIEEVAFSDCKNLTSVTLPSTIKSIDGYAFASCTSLTEVIIPENVTSISFEVSYFGHESFSGCPKLSLASQARLKQLGYVF